MKDIIFKILLAVKIFRNTDSRIKAGRWVSYLILALAAFMLFAVSLFLSGMGSGDKLIEGIKQTTPVVIMFFFFSLLLLWSYNREPFVAQAYVWLAIFLLCLSQYGGFLALVLATGQLAWQDNKKKSIPYAFKNHAENEDQQLSINKIIHNQG